ncbi:MAG: ribosome biogenesis GTP-binding protein YihA/YsxC [Bacteroidales bacterium]|nr:ribosome biogenesis GTP-binding protein YihA/YsxC [Bacteroidales bacterium]MDD2424879.1 ribosome biogenesis GTP-binding protein YihA/YsxC [Bacteroidales bacterium]MDD3989736.1 ribosome biogenesis GTP-binding protein YihA/YsxC [Bacteroidales bacterium]MDD4638867.1 ribosome biogenesis GTP-binding protein YihA/YsxC [Bacteroidales bacterium]
MIINKAIFSGSCRNISERAGKRLPEFAFIGRSNVGKSSIINSLCRQGKIAHTSSTPGKTRLINHFLINDSWYLVDLPGYGYAKMSREGRKELDEMIRGYINGSQELVSLFVLLDSRHTLQKVDLKFLIELGEAEIPFSIVFTKCDKLGQEALKNRIAENSELLLEYWEELPPVFISSSETGRGRDEILDYIKTQIKIYK